MRGAVLHKLGLDFVKDRIVRKSYGVTFNAEFRRGHHPVSRKINCLDGVTRCENVMDWYARRVYAEIYSGRLIFRMTNWQMVLARNILFSGIFLLLNSKKRDHLCIERNYTVAINLILQSTMNPI